MSCETDKIWASVAGGIYNEYHILHGYFDHQTAVSVKKLGSSPEELNFQEDADIKSTHKLISE